MKEYSSTFCQFIGSKEGLEYLQTINKSFGGGITIMSAIEFAAFMLGEE